MTTTALPANKPVSVEEYLRIKEQIVSNMEKLIEEIARIQPKNQQSNSELERLYHARHKNTLYLASLEERCPKELYPKKKAWWQKK